MGRIFKRDGDSLERDLRESRPQPSDELVSRLEERVERSRPGRAWSRVAFAGAVTVLMLGTFSSFGGLSYAGSSAQGTVKVVKHIVVPVKVRQTVSVKTSATDQYGNVTSSVTKVTKTVVKPTVKSKTVTVPTTKPATVTQSETLPFTGFSLLGTLILSLALIALGIFLRRREARE